jgi:hypothetical protein
MIYGFIPKLTFDMIEWSSLRLRNYLPVQPCLKFIPTVLLWDINGYKSLTGKF